MPPSPGIYNSTFVSGAITGGFDVMKSEYHEERAVNSTQRTIPWASNNYAIVVQSRATQLRRRRYTVVVYLETDYGALRQLVSLNGTLTTPREIATLAMLESVHRGTVQDATTTTGPQTLLLTFVMLA
jgi:hypothetical protein